MSRAVSYAFGSVITTPLTDESGVNQLTTNQVAGYWQSIPWPDITNTVVSATNVASYYYSPNAGYVFATQPGPVWITWITTTSYQPSDTQYLQWTNYQNPGAPPGTPSFYTIGNNVYWLFTASYVVASTPVKPPHSIF
jgi:hypothetical protein